MRIVVQRGGGYAEITETLFDVDTASLDLASAAELKQLVADAEAAAKTIATSQPIGADLLKYEFNVTDENGQRTWTVIDDNTAVLEPIRRLLDYLTRYGKSQ